MVRIFNHFVPTSILLLLLLEAAIFVASVYFAAWIRFPEPELYETLDPLWPKAGNLALFMVMTLGVFGLYQANLREPLRGIVLRLIATFLFGFALMSIVFYIVPALYIGRGVLGIALCLSLVTIVTLRTLFFHWSSMGILQSRILVLGTGTRAINVDEVARGRNPRGKFQVVGYLPLLATQHHVSPSRVLPSEDSIMAVVAKYRVDEIVIAVRDRRGGGLPVQQLLECRLSGVKVTELSSFFERECGQLRLDALNTSWMVLGEGFRQGLFRDTSKRIFDVLVSGLLLFLTVPFMLFTAFSIYFESGAPIFYRQERIGQGGKSFSIFKFRSMRTDAEKDGAPRWAKKDDDRTTKVGRVIRKLRIDELPQIFNVLTGDMSFVGPRPERPYFVTQLMAQIPYYAARHSIKPGLTGWAQVRYPYGASLDDAIEKLQYDLYYVKNHSLFLDIMILLDTIRVVLWGQGAR
ncbi:MAG: TIGR03013 family XrtA/PEP-CTERM system glycosyltransferase [Burkholderiales bacterium]